MSTKGAAALALLLIERDGVTWVGETGVSTFPGDRVDLECTSSYLFGASRALQVK